MNNEKPEVIFVYNADSGLFNLLSDIAHKSFSPQTYACHLCALTHSNFGMKKEWKGYLKTLATPFEFYHADEFRNKFQTAETELPAIFKADNRQLSLLLSAAEINSCRSINELKNRINTKLHRI